MTDITNLHSSYRLPFYTVMPELAAKITPNTSSHTRFTETQAGALICHDYEDQKYYRTYQSEIDLDIIRRYVTRNLCSNYPDVTFRYFAMNWPELCIFVSHSLKPMTV